MVHDEHRAHTPDNAPQRDWFLQFLVNLANKNQFELDITLTVGGLLISGTLAGVKQYFADFGNDFAASFDSGRGSDGVKLTFKRIGDECSCIAKPEPHDAPSYIHLKNAEIFDARGNAVHGARSVWWRGRISEVHGFIPGRLTGSVPPGI